MKRRLSSQLLTLTLLVSTALPVVAQAVRAAAPESLPGAIAMGTAGQTVVIAVADEPGGEIRHLVVIEAADTLPQLTFSSAQAHLQAWPGQVVVTAPVEGRAFHFSLETAPVFVPFGSAEHIVASPDPRAVDTFLQSGYNLTSISGVASILVQSGRLDGMKWEQILSGELARRLGGRLRPLGLEEIEPFQQGPGGGSASCGTSCSQGCGDGSACSITCAPPRCAKCTCPLDCACVAGSN